MITIKVNKETLNIIENDYKDFITDRNIGYILFVIKKDDTIITAYDNKKGANFSVTFQGKNPYEMAKVYSGNQIVPKKNKEDKESPFFIDCKAQIGSDEVGTGDFLGPVVVCAAFVDEETMKVINEYHIVDSKKLKDADILKVVPLLLQKVFYEVKILSIEKYNNAVKKGFNLNAIKAILHNHVLLTLHKRCPYVSNIYVDQFTPEDKYYEYLKGVKNVQKDIVFKEKGETYFPSVALASCLSRYFFLKEIEKVNDKYKVKVPLGAGEKVDKFAQAFVNKFGKEEFDKISKTSFANYKKLKF